MYNGGNLSSQIVNARVVSVLSQLLTALEAAQRLSGWASGITQADLEGIGFGPADATALLSAIADANGFAALYNTGTDSRNPGPGYVYGASQRQVIGPQLCTLTPTG